MNERNRRNQQARRHAPPTHNHHNHHHHHHNHHHHQQQQLNNRSIYHNNGETYLASNYRHPSTTTTTATDPSSITASQSTSTSSGSSSSCDDCAVSMFYSYLIAIVCSFLVVLGIYLALTRFNARFLYISLVGLSIEAIGACVYCISNIHSRKLAQRKQRINSNEFILSGTTSGNNGINLNNNGTAALRQQQQITSITHILSNRTLNTNINENEASAININNDNLVRPTQPTSLGLENVNATLDENSNLPIDGDERATISSNNLGGQQQDQTNQIASNFDTANVQQQDTSNQQLPENQNYRQSPSVASEDFLSSTCLLGPQQQQQQSSGDNLESNNLTQVKESVDEHDNGRHQAPTSQLSINMVSQFNSQLGDNKNTKSANLSAQNENLPGGGGEGNVAESSGQQHEADTSSRIINLISVESDSVAPPLQTTGHDNPSDLISLQASGSGGLVVSAPLDPQNVAPKRTKTAQAQQSRANLRRTLVMGLSGEEELIEINEEDLDNMSILPPPYESITNTNSNSNNTNSDT